MAIDRISNNDVVSQIKDVFRNQGKSVKGAEDKSFREILATTESQSTEKNQPLTDSVEIKDKSFAAIPDDSNGNVTAPPADRQTLISFAEKAVLQAKDVRSNKIQSIRQMIEQGNYHIPAEEVADSLLQSRIFDDLI